ncbi:3-dehydroquinate dehydratase, partial [Streptococcus sp. SPC0]|nr:3-dehydroquinate dehydratase [Streptococcus sp. SPC0]
VTGSSWTFAYLDSSIAPGQITISEMKRVKALLDAD